MTTLMNATLPAAIANTATLVPSSVEGIGLPPGLTDVDAARITATITGSVGARQIESRIIDGERIEVRATWHRRDEVADFKHVAKEVRR